MGVTSDSPISNSRPSLPMWHKPPGIVCQFIKESRCSIYDQRPLCCRDFVCEWLVGKPIRKPTESGVVFFIKDTPIGDETIVVTARTDAPFQDEETKKEIQSYREQGYPVAIIHDENNRTIVE